MQKFAAEEMQQLIAASEATYSNELKPASRASRTSTQRRNQRRDTWRSATLWCCSPSEESVS